MSKAESIFMGLLVAFLVFFGGAITATEWPVWNTHEHTDTEVIKEYHDCIMQTATIAPDLDHYLIEESRVFTCVP